MKNALGGNFKKLLMPLL